MPRRGARKIKPQATSSNADGFESLIAKFLESLQVRNYSAATVKGRGHYLSEFARWCSERGVYYPREVTKPLLERYQRWLYHYRKKDGQPLSFRSQFSTLAAVRSLFKWLTRDNRILYNPASELELPRLERRLPRHVLTIAEAERVINLPRVTDPIGLRDRAILETLYSSGIRRMELANLKRIDLDDQRGTLLIRQGKGKKDRMVPIGERAIAWITRYVHDSRPILVREPDEGFLFLTNPGDPFTPNRLTQLVREYVDRAELGKRGSCHLFRHTMATLMLENGADVRYIQEMLGHAKLETTQIYTQVSIRRLKEIHSMTHPAKLHREQSSPQPPKTSAPSSAF